MITYPLVVAILATSWIHSSPQRQTAVKGEAAIRGLYKAVAIDSKNPIPGADGKFKFEGDHEFTFTRKTMTQTIVTHGMYKIEGDQVEISPVKKNANWPSFWQAPSALTIKPAGELAMHELTFLPSLIGKVFRPGLYQCDKNHVIHYYFDANGGYKTTGVGYMSTGEYWVESEKDVATGQEQPFLILNILRVDGKRVNFHQRIDLHDGGKTFIMEGKFPYHRVSG